MDENGNVNVEKIMEEIRQKIRDEHLTSPVISFDDVPLATADSLLNNGYDSKVLQSCTEYVAARNRLDYNQPITGNPLKCFVKRLIRKLVQFYVVPIVVQQNALNSSYSTALMQINGFIQGVGDSELLALASRIDELEMRELCRKKEIDELREQIKLLHDELDGIRGA